MNKDRQEQKMLHEQYYEEMKRVWGEEEMAVHCTKSAARIIETTDGKLMTIEKPKIMTNFCFGYSDSKYDTEEYDDANRMVEYALRSQTYFIRQNLKEMKSVLKMLKSVRNGGKYKLYIHMHYSLSPEDTKAYGWGVMYRNDKLEERDVKEKGCRYMDTETLDRLITGYKLEIIAFHKRLRQYLKRYGLSKVNAWSYWRDE